MFLDRLELAERFAALLGGAGVERGLIGPREVSRLWDRHLLNCGVLTAAFPHGADIADLGSGAGLPGVVLAVARPDISVVLVEPLQRRTDFLTEAVMDLGLDNVEVVRARAEQLHGRREFTYVTSRAVAPLRRLLDWSMPLVRQGGCLVAMKGTNVQREIEEAVAEVARHGGDEVAVVRYGQGLVDPQTTAVRVRATRPSRLASAGEQQAASPPARPRRGAKRPQAPRRTGKNHRKAR